jgi:hypothetical protein
MQVLGLPILIEWDKFQPGTSFFIPCLDRRGMERFVRAEARRLRLNVICKQVVENKVYGLRVWRIDATVPPHSSPSGC